MDDHYAWVTASTMQFIGFAGGAIAMELRGSWFLVPWLVATAVVAAAWWNWRKRN